MHELIYTTLAIPGKPERDVLMLAESIRTFGGDLASHPIWVLVPEVLGTLSESTQQKLTRLNVEIIPFEADPEILKFPFAAKIVAAALAEQQAHNKTRRLVFMDRDTIMLQAPHELRLSSDQVLGYRPVHHKLIGSAWDEPLDAFWALIYEACNVPQEHIFPMVTHAGERIRPYFNAGMFVLRPERGLLAQWETEFLKWYRQPPFTRYYEADQLYTIFSHQAIFTGVLLSALHPEEMQLLSPKINYPLHLHSEIPAGQRPDRIDKLVTVRYENVFDESGWEQLPITETLKNWLEAQPRLYQLRKRHYEN